jgi:hypothetical protein
MIAPHPAGRLGWRLRVYLAIVAARSLGMGVTYWASAPRIWRSPAFDVIEQLAPLRTFAILWLVLGLVAVGGVLFPGERGIRGVLVTSFGLELLFGLGVLLGYRIVACGGHLVHVRRDRSARGRDAVDSDRWAVR